jgi:hypothetical protein
LQGTSEKIHFQGFVCQQSLEPKDLLAQDDLAGSARMRVGFIKSLSPDVKQSASYAELAGEPNNVVARVHSLNSLLPKLVRVSLPSFSRHFAAPFPQSVLHQFVSL